MVRLTLPNPTPGDATGIAGIKFTDSVAYITEAQYKLIAEAASRHGYSAEPCADPPAKPETKPAASADDPSKWTKQDLVDYATAHGLAVTSAMNKAEMLSIVEEYRVAQAQPPAVNTDPSEQPKPNDDTASSTETTAAS